jgi:hypothetical protein
VTRVFLSLSALLWVLYGLYCFAEPTQLAEAAGVGASTTTGTIELRAMYGGLQVAIGLLAGAAVLMPRLRPAALLTLAFLCGGLGLARLCATVLAAEVSAYTGGALGFELFSAGVSIWLLRSGRAQPSSAGGDLSIRAS